MATLGLVLGFDARTCLKNLLTLGTARNQKFLTTKKAQSVSPPESAPKPGPNPGGKLLHAGDSSKALKVWREGVFKVKLHLSGQTLYQVASASF